jgi:DUF2924 family protein
VGNVRQRTCSKNRNPLSFRCLGRVESHPTSAYNTSKEILLCFALACGAAKSVHVTVVDGHQEEKRTVERAVLMEIENLRRASLTGLREKYRTVFQEETRCRHREHLFRRIAWRLQALAEGDLSERARGRAHQIAI